MMMMITHMSVWMGKTAQVFSAVLMTVAQGHGVKTGCMSMYPKLTPTLEYSSQLLLASSTLCTGLGISISYKHTVRYGLSEAWTHLKYLKIICKFPILSVLWVDKGRSVFIP